MNEIIDYGDVKLNTLKIIFGDEMTFNELNSLENRKYRLIVEYTKIQDYLYIDVQFDDKIVLNKKINELTGNIMIETLIQIRPTGKKVTKNCN